MDWTGSQSHAVPLSPKTKRDPQCWSHTRTLHTRPTYHTPDRTSTEPGTAAHHTCNPNIWEVEAGGLQVQDQPVYCALYCGHYFLISPTCKPAFVIPREFFPQFQFLRVLHPQQSFGASPFRSLPLGWPALASSLFFLFYISVPWRDSSLYS